MKKLIRWPIAFMFTIVTPGAVVMEWALCEEKTFKSVWAEDVEFLKEIWKGT